MKAGHSFITVIIFVVFFSFLFMAHYSGYIGVTKLTGGNGCDCHTQSSAVNVVISGPSSLSRGGKGTFTVTITGGPLKAAGVDIAAGSGKLISNPGEEFLQLDVGELTHTMPKPPANNKVVFTFDYIAPTSAGTATLYAVGNSVNTDGDNTGDGWNFASNKTITVTNATDVRDEHFSQTFRLENNYPNPFNPESTISYQTQENGFVTLKVYDLFGKETATLVNEEKAAGHHEVKFNAANLASGVYLYTLRSGKLTETKKMILSK